VCAANRRTHKGSSAQLTTIGLDTSYIGNAVQTLTKVTEHTVLFNSLILTLKTNTISKKRVSFQEDALDTLLGLKRYYQELSDLRQVALSNLEQYRNPCRESARRSIILNLVALWK
jgi:hypothetical protein